jgi:Fe-S cluster biogenesis protein NfuA/nitrite reductase/ring-hydroxylating ferredoxin subunit
MDTRQSRKRGFDPSSLFRILLKLRSGDGLMSENKEVQRRIESIEGLVREIEKLSDPGAQSLSKQLVQSLMDLHGMGLERMLEITHHSGAGGQKIIDEMGRDELVGSLLLLYGLHPLDLEARVLQALEKSRPYLKSHDGNVELVSVSKAGVVTLKLEGSCHSCPSSAVTLQSTVERAIFDLAPDVTSIVVEGVVTEPAAAGSFIPLASLQAKQSTHGDGQGPAAQTEWEEVFGLDALPPGILRKQDVAGEPVLFCQLNEDLYAYGITCPGCGQTLEGGHLENTILACPICLQKYDLVHAGRTVDISPLHLEPIPLLWENGRAKVAVLSRARSAV